MRRAAAPSMLLALAACAGPQAYQNTSWGMDEKAFRAARPASQAAGERLWVEPATINSLKAMVTYRLGAQGLEAVSIIFDPVQVEPAKYVDYFHQVKALLTEKYGAPEVSAADLAVRAQKVRMAEAPDYQGKSVFRAPAALIELTCGGRCDGTTKGDSIAISYGAPRSPTAGL